MLPRPERVLQALLSDWRLISLHLWYTPGGGDRLRHGHPAGIGLAVLFTSFPIGRYRHAGRDHPAQYPLRGAGVGSGAGDGRRMATKVMIVTLAGFFPVLVNTYRGLQSVDPIVLDRMRILDASWWEVFSKVRFPYSIPYILAAQEITGSASIVVSIAVEWMISRTGLGYVIHQGMMQYRGDLVYAVALIAALFSFGVYTLIHYFGERLDWREGSGARR